MSQVFIPGWLQYRKCFPENNLTCARSSMDRASVFGTEGWGFESLRAYLFYGQSRGGGIQCQAVPS